MRLEPHLSLIFGLVSFIMAKYTPAWLNTLQLEHEANDLNPANDGSPEARALRRTMQYPQTLDEIFDRQTRTASWLHPLPEVLHRHRITCHQIALRDTVSGDRSESDLHVDDEDGIRPMGTMSIYFCAKKGEGLAGMRIITYPIHRLVS
jgi:hypothetical protein